MPKKGKHNANINIENLTKPRYGVALAWDELDESAENAVDLDLQAVIVDDRGQIIDAVYFNNLSGINGAVEHTGDEASGVSEGYDEAIWVRLDLLPPSVKLIIFVIASYHNGHLIDVQNGEIILLQESAGHRIRTLKVEPSAGDVDVVCMLRRARDGSWQFVEIDEPADYGAHFMDILEPNLGNIIRKEIAGAPAVQKVTFIMQKGSVIQIPPSSVRRVSVGIGGTMHAGAEYDADIDISAVFYNRDGENIGTCDFSNDKLYGVTHSGDGTCGDNDDDDDDEAVNIDLTQTPQEVEMIFVILTVNNGSFEGMKSCYARVADQHGGELVRYEVDAGNPASGLVIAGILRSQGGWGFSAAGVFFVRQTNEDGTPSWDEAHIEMKRLFDAAREEVAEDKGGDSPSKGKKGKRKKGTKDASKGSNMARRTSHADAVAPASAPDAAPAPAASAGKAVATPAEGEKIAEVEKPADADKAAGSQAAVDSPKAAADSPRKVKRFSRAAAAVKAASAVAGAAKAGSSGPTPVRGEEAPSFHLEAAPTAAGGASAPASSLVPEDGAEGVQAVLPQAAPVSAKKVEELDVVPFEEDSSSANAKPQPCCGRSSSFFGCG